MERKEKMLSDDKGETVMNRLTQKRVNGIKTGYWSTSKKDELVTRLAEYEDTGLNPEEVLRLKKNAV